MKFPIRAIAGFTLAWALTACSSMPNTRPRIDLSGDPANPAAATRTIVISPETRYVNVMGGETVKFVEGDKAFAWSFNPAGSVPPFDLRLLAPPGTLDHQVMAYIEVNPRYFPSW